MSGRSGEMFWRSTIIGNLSHFIAVDGEAKLECEQNRRGDFPCRTISSVQGEREREQEETVTMSSSESSKSLSSLSPAHCIATIRERCHCISRRAKDGRGRFSGSSVVIWKI